MAEISVDTSASDAHRSRLYQVSLRWDLRLNSWTAGHRTACGGSRSERRDDGRIADDESSRRAGIGIAFLHAVYTSVQTLELRGKTATSRHFWTRSACLPRGTARSINLLPTSTSAQRCLRRGDQKTSWRRKPKSAISTSADCSVPQVAHIGTRPARVLRDPSVDAQT
jgi:hypothetical protein